MGPAPPVSQRADWRAPAIRRDWCIQCNKCRQFHTSEASLPGTLPTIYVKAPRAAVLSQPRVLFPAGIFRYTSVSEHVPATTAVRAHAATEISGARTFPFHGIADLCSCVPLHTICAPRQLFSAQSAENYTAASPQLSVYLPVSQVRCITGCFTGHRPRPGDERTSRRKRASHRHRKLRYRWCRAE